MYKECASVYLALSDHTVPLEILFHNCLLTLTRSLIQTIITVLQHNFTIYFYLFQMQTVLIVLGAKRNAEKVKERQKCPCLLSDIAYSYIHHKPILHGSLDPVPERE